MFHMRAWQHHETWSGNLAADSVEEGSSLGITLAFIYSKNIHIISIISIIFIVIFIFYIMVLLVLVVLCC